jgi:hypothetical protein
VLRLSAAKEIDHEIDKIFESERDRLIRAVVSFHFGRPTMLTRAVEYGVRCHRHNPVNRAATLIRAMFISGRSIPAIASEMATRPVNIAVFLKLFFDVGPYLDRRCWLRQVCLPVFDRPPTPTEQCEARLLSIAFDRGWSALSATIRPKRCEPAKIAGADMARLIQVLSARSADYLTSLELLGVPPSERDLFLLAVVQRTITGFDLPLSPNELTYQNPLDPDEAKTHKAQIEELRKLGPDGRRRILDIISRLQSLDRAGRNKSNE